MIKRSTLSACTLAAFVVTFFPSTAIGSVGCEYDCPPGTWMFSCSSVTETKCRSCDWGKYAVNEARFQPGVATDACQQCPLGWMGANAQHASAQYRQILKADVSSIDGRFPPDIYHDRFSCSTSVGSNNYPGGCFGASRDDFVISNGNDFFYPISKSCLPCPPDTYASGLHAEDNRWPCSNMCPVGKTHKRTGATSADSCLDCGTPTGDSVKADVFNTPHSVVYPTSSTMSCMPSNGLVKENIVVGLHTDQINFPNVSSVFQIREKDMAGRSISVCEGLSGAFSVLDGDPCTVEHARSGACVMSPNYPENFGGRQQCEITVERDLTLDVKDFQVGGVQVPDDWLAIAKGDAANCKCLSNSKICCKNTKDSEDRFMCPAYKAGTDDCTSVGGGPHGRSMSKGDFIKFVSGAYGQEAQKLEVYKGFKICEAHEIDITTCSSFELTGSSNVIRKVGSSVECEASGRYDHQVCQEWDKNTGNDDVLCSKYDTSSYCSGKTLIGSFHEAKCKRYENCDWSTTWTTYGTDRKVSPYPDVTRVDFDPPTMMQACGGYVAKITGINFKGNDQPMKVLLYTTRNGATTWIGVKDTVDNGNIVIEITGAKSDTDTTIIFTMPTQLPFSGRVQVALQGTFGGPFNNAGEQTILDATSFVMSPPSTSSCKPSAPTNFAQAADGSTSTAVNLKWTHSDFLAGATPADTKYCIFFFFSFSSSSSSSFFCF